MAPKKKKVIKTQPKKLLGLVDVPKTWYKEHVDKQKCGCQPGTPSKMCDVGEALWRIKLCEERKRGTYEAYE